MELLKQEEIASVTLFDLKLSEGELMVYENCIEFVLNNCSEEYLYKLTGCENREELASYQQDLNNLIKTIINKKYLPEKYKD
ncbi:hypothetical protein [Paenibacillus paeoniae]|uniref:Uncharacterized protein n=1 Tax=Paenibacillus paeoniae TaxID=2292705 RepID=A0A371P0W9_9BACL|nr:hypothetical protein [Paenibacillus paeoniae]REK69238.1 hypothetical protein DX130_25325 [Paenibacillus paeoniae]